jgi:serine/threonine protein kinase/WD40 repeat protein
MSEELTDPPPLHELPPDIEERCYALWFDRTAAERPDALDALLSEHPAHRDGIRRLFDHLAGGDRALEPFDGGPADAVPPARIGSYELIDELGRGGFGRVYRARQHEPVRRLVALKFLDAAAGHVRAIARFALERQALARMQHPCIAQVYDAGTAPDGRPFIAMELVDGLPITRYCDEHRLDLEARIELLLRVCDGVTHAHQRGIVHRDLKPSNVLVVDRDGAPRPKIIDFGVAKALDDELGAGLDATIDGGFVGTPSYTSPEQAAGGAIDTRTDVHALGVMLHELLTGDLPFDRRRLQTSSLIEALRVIREEEPQLPSRSLRSAAPEVAELRSTTLRRLRQRVRGDLDWIARRALERDVDRRYASVEAFADELRRFLDDRPIEARRPTLTYVFGKLARRHRLLVGAAATLLLALVGTALVVGWSLFRVETAMDAALAEGNRAARSEYAAQIAAAKLALDMGDAPGAGRILAATAPGFRGWEHALLTDLCEDAVLTFAPELRVRALEWLVDGELAVLPYTGGAEIWDPDTARRLAEVAGQAGFLERVAPLGDRRRLITARRDRGVRRDPRSGEMRAMRELELVDLVDRRVVRKLAEIPAGIDALAVSGDGIWFACFDQDRVLHRGRVDGSGALERWEQVKLPVSALAFWPDGGSLVLGTVHGQVVRAALDRQLIEPRFSTTAFAPHEGPIQVLATDPGRRLLISADLQSRIAIWELDTGVLRNVIPVPAEVRELRLDGEQDRLYASGGFSEPMLAAWDLDTGEPLGHFDGHRLGVEGLALAPDGRRIAASDRAGGVRIFEAAPRSDSQRIELGYDSRSMALAPDGARLASCSMDGQVRVFDTEAWELRGTFEIGAALQVVALAADRLFVVGWDGLLRRLDSASGTLEATASVAEPGSTARAIATDRSGRRVAVTTDQRRLIVLDGGPLEAAWERGLEELSSALAFTPDGSALVVATAADSIERLDARDGAVLATGRIDAGGMFGFAFGPGGRLLAVACGNGAVVLVDALGLGEVGRIDAHSEAVFAVAFSPDGSRLASSGLDRTVRIFDAGSMNQLLVLDTARTGVDDLHFLPDGQRLIVRAHRWYQRTWLHVWDADRPRRR